MVFVDLSPNCLQKIKEYELLIMDFIHEICIKNNIHYSLFYGSLIGAIMYKGFIPWDDDIDIVMFRDQYNKFIDAFSKTKQDKFFLQNIECEKKYIVPGITKIRLNGTELVEAADRRRNIHHGVWVDITVLENCKNLSQVRRAKYYFSLFRTKYYYFSSLRHFSFKGFVYNSLVKMKFPWGIKRTGKKFIYYSKMCKNNNSELVFQPFSYEDDVYERKDLSNYCLYCFEGREYMGFEEYDKILRVRYPNYDIPLKKEQQKTNHNFVKVVI